MTGMPVFRNCMCQTETLQYAYLVSPSPSDRDVHVQSIAVLRTVAGWMWVALHAPDFGDGRGLVRIV